MFLVLQFGLSTLDGIMATIFVIIFDQKPATLNRDPPPVGPSVSLRNMISL
jgi:hypothetical protein